MADAFTYTHDADVCRGFIALPAGGGTAPGIALFADIGGVGAHTKGWATRIAAELGYVALAADVYGEGRNPADRAEGMAWLNAYRNDPPRLAARAHAALAALKAHPRCNGQLAAIGFCFGGTTVLELARSGDPDLMAAVSFHGGLATPAPAGPGAITAKLLVCHGAEDPVVPPQQLVDFLAEMATAGADCQTIAYTGAGHSFTNEQADGSIMPGIKYHAPTARRSYGAMRTFLDEVFAV